MGLDVHYQAIPESCPLLTRARYQPDFGIELEFFKSYALMPPEETVRCADNQHLIEFLYEVRQLCQQHPGIEHRNLYLGHRWDMLYYLLSERRRRRQERDWSHWAEKTIFGSEVLNEATQTTIGFPMRYLYPAEVSEVRNNLEGVTLEMLHTHWNPRKMGEAGVYKIPVDEDEADFKWIKADFEQLTAFYALVAKQGEGVLVFIG